MGKSIEEMYQDLLLEDNSDKGFRSSGSSYDLDDDGEDFITSKELVKAQQELEERFGVTPRGTVDIEEELHFKSYSKRREHKYTETELEQIRKSCEMSIVHDYGENDIFHMTDEERAEVDMLSEISMKLGGLKRTYRRVDQYIEAMRTVIQAWELLEQKANFIHTRDEFFTMVGEGKIVSNRIIMPKLKKMDMYNIDTIIKYISNPEMDASELLPEKDVAKDPWYDDFDLEEDEDYQAYYDEYINLHKDDEDLDEYDLRIKADEYARSKIEEDEYTRLLSPEEVEYITKNIDNPPEIRVKELPRRYIKGYDRRSFIDSRKKKHIGKKEQMIIDDVHGLLNAIQNNPENRDDGDFNRSYLITHSMFDTDAKPFKNFWDDLYFDGSWASDTDVYLLELAIREEMLKQHPPRDKYLTYADRELNNFFSIAEKNGINTIELRKRMELTESGSVTSKAEVRAKAKENKKLENAILQRITKLNDDPKFKKLATKAEMALNKFYDS